VYPNLLYSWLFSQLYYNTSTIYLGYAVIIQRQGALGMPIYSMKILLTALSFLVILGDALLLQIVCEHLMAEENRVCVSPRLQRRNKDVKAAHRQVRKQPGIYIGIQIGQNNS